MPRSFFRGYPLTGRYSDCAGARAIIYETRLEGGVQHRYVLLDGMRGIAAFAVMFMHFAWQGGLEFWVFPHAHLAVDFFFLLSGFVIANAYDARLRDGQLRFGTFAVSRLIRLYPMVAIGTLMGFAVQASIATSVAGFASSLPALARLAAGLLLEPFTYDPAKGALVFGFALNNPIWSLFWEMVANLIYAAIAPRLRTRTLATFTALAALVLVAFGLTHNGLNRGPWDAWPGFVRVSFSFPAGILLWRLRDHLGPRRTSTVALLLVLTFALALPLIPHVNSLYELGVALFLFPILVAEASKIRIGGSALRAGAFAGAISYPLYASHYPLAIALQTIIQRLALKGGGTGLLIVAMAMCAIILSYALLRYVDEPLRTRLRRAARVRSFAQTQTAP